MLQIEMLPGTGGGQDLEQTPGAGERLAMPFSGAAPSAAGKSDNVEF